MAMRFLRIVFLLGILPFAVAGANAAQEPEAQELKGILLERKAGGYLNVRIEEGKFEILFLDAEKKPVPGNLDRAILRYRPAMREEERVVLNRDREAMKLTSPRIVRPPYVYKIFLTLFEPGATEPTETYTADFSQN